MSSIKTLRLKKKIRKENKTKQTNSKLDQIQNRKYHQIQRKEEKLVEVDKKYIPEYKEAYIKAKELVEKGIIKKHNMMFHNPDEVDIVDYYLSKKDESRLPSNYVPSYSYFLINDNGKFAGIVNIRVRLTDNLLKYGGHIGYA